MDNKLDVLENLKMADDFIQTMFPHITDVTFTVSGGASFILKGCKNKVTLDIDSITPFDASIRDYMESFSINDSASEVTKLPASYKERVRTLKGFRILKVSLLSTEDLILSKLNRLSEDDLYDLFTTGIMDMVNLELLTNLAEELIDEYPPFESKWRYFNVELVRRGYIWSKSIS